MKYESKVSWLRTLKAKERKIKILKLIQKLKKASWSEVQKETGIQSKELSYDLKELLKNNKIIAEKDIGDRRKTWYKLVDNDQTKAELNRYEVIDFIESLKDPFFLELKAEEGPYKVLQSWFLEIPDRSIIDYVKKTTNRQITKEQIVQGKLEIKAELEKKLSEILKITTRYMEIRDFINPQSCRKFVEVSAYEYGESEKQNE